MEENAVTSVIGVSPETGIVSETAEETGFSIPAETEIQTSPETENTSIPSETIPEFMETKEFFTGSIPTGATDNFITENTDIPVETYYQETVTESAVTESVDYTENATMTAFTEIPETSAETTVTEVTEISVTNSVTEEYTVTDIQTEAVSELVTESAAEIPQNDSAIMQFVTEFNSSGAPYILIPAAALAAAAALKKKKKIKNDSAKKYARERDAERLQEQNAGRQKKKHRSEKPEKEKKNLSKKVMNTMPYRKILSDDIWYLGSRLYSKVYTFDDINFNLADEEQQYMYLERYIEFTNILDDTVDCQISLWNSRLNMEDFRKRTLMKQKADDFFDLRYEYNSRVLEENIKKGQNAIQKHMYVTLTIKAPDEESAQRKFQTLDIAAINSFNRIGNTNLRVLTSQERVEMLKDFFIGTNEMPVPKLTAENFERGEDKLYCSPDYFDFRDTYFMFNDYYAKTIYIRDYPSTATSEILADLMASGIEIIVTSNLETYDSAQARKLVQHQITAIDTDMAKREVKAAQHGNFSSQMPQRIKNQRDSMVSVYDKITTKDQKLFLTNTQILIKAKSYDELENNLEIIEGILKRSGCVKGEMKWQQEDGLYDCLPCGYQRKFSWHRTMPSESVAIFIPFNVKEVQMPDAVYYGLNVLSHNIIMFDRITGLINPAGFILGASGGGKSFKVKEELLGVRLRHGDEVDIIIIDPEREYHALVKALGGTVVKFATGSKNYINPLDFDPSLLDIPDDGDETIDVIADQCQLITSFISCMDPKHPLNAQEKSFIDRCVRRAYIKSGVLENRDVTKMPLLGDFLREMENDDTVNKEMREKLCVIIDMYVNGSAKYYNNPTNVNAANSLISYDIRDLNGNLKTQSMLLILNYVWNRLVKNRDLGRSTYIYFDEAHLLFADEYCLDFLRMLWKRARKYGGVLTGITQNVEDLLKDEKSRSMLANSEFLVLLKQNPTDAAKLQDILNFTDSEIHYCKDTPPGCGVLVLGGKDKIPFYDEFPKDTKLYRLISTSFSETAAIKANANYE